MKAVLFDLFETLVTQQYPDRPTQQSFADRLGLELEDVRAWWRTSSRDRMTGKFASYRETLSALCEALCTSVDAATLDELSKDRESRKRDYLLEVEPKTIRLLSRLRASGWRVGILSNATPDEIVCWPECPLRDVVDDHVFSCQVNTMKPEAEIYHLACERLQFRPKEGVFVGDGGFDELQGAAAVGMRPVQAKWYASRDIAWETAPKLASVDCIDDLFDHLEGMSS